MGVAVSVVASSSQSMTRGQETLDLCCELGPTGVLGGCLLFKETLRPSNWPIGQRDGAIRCAVYLAGMAWALATVAAFVVADWTTNLDVRRMSSLMLLVLVMPCVF